MVLSIFRAFWPRHRSLEQRLKEFPTTGLPLEERVIVRWDDHAIPFIEAKTDRDLAFTLGLVHAHLREGQLALAKRLVYGRVSEMVGPPAFKLDHGLRLLGFESAARASERAMPADTLAWMQAFADGLNHYQQRASQPPPEFGLLGLKREPWTVSDVLAIGRLAGTDINWVTYMELLERRLSPQWPVVWERALEAGANTAHSFAEVGTLTKDLLLGFSRSGSNSVVVAPGRSATGGALIACDPHLPLMLPNLWLLVGVKSPALHAVGLMPAGLPVFGVGRTFAIGWGGTNMRALSSDLYNVAGEALQERAERIRGRWWRGRTVRVRGSRHGVVVSDSPLFKARPGEVIAMRWAGHAGSDEITALLQAARATSAEEFRAAFRSYGVGGQSMQFADRAGNIGQIMAVWLPKRRYRLPADLVLDGSDQTTAWNGFLNATELPWTLNPEEGFIASANNPPTELDVPIGYFFITPERVQRLQTLLRSKTRFTVEDLRRLQEDVVSPAAASLSGALIQAIDQARLAHLQPDFVDRLRGWDGSYRVNAVEPVLFETLLARLVGRLAPRPRSDWSNLVSFLAKDLAVLPAASRAKLLRQALAEAVADAAKYSKWGDMHRVRAQSILARLPLIGRRFRVTEFPSGGSRETVMKTAHGLVRRRHAASYGAQSRFIADMSDPDSSWFVLFGGQDGWLGSGNYADQLGLWRRGDYVQMPLSEAGVRARFQRVQALEPQRASTR